MLSELKSLAKAINKINGDPVKGFEEDFKFLFDSTLEQMSTDEDREREQYEQDTPYAFHPSNLGACVRCVFYNFLKYPAEKGSTDAALKNIVDHGTDRHDRVQRVLLNMNRFKYIDAKDYMDEVRAKGLNTVIADCKENKGVFGEDLLEYRFYNADFPVWFRTDGIFEFRGLKGIFEFKTEISFKFNNRLSPDPLHIQQATIYASMLGLEYLLFRYEERDTFKNKIYLLKVDPEVKNAIFEKASYIKFHADYNELPPATEDQKECTRSYCKHTKKCKEDYISDERYQAYLEYKKGLNLNVCE